MTIQLKTIALWWQRSPVTDIAQKRAKKKNADRAKEQLSKLGHEASARQNSRFQTYSFHQCSDFTSVGRS
jgi:hypothetical protein